MSMIEVGKISSNCSHMHTYDDSLDAEQKQTYINREESSKTVNESKQIIAIKGAEWIDLYDDEEIKIRVMYLKRFYHVSRRNLKAL